MTGRELPAPLLDGAKLRLLRLAAGHTERGLARLLGISPLRLRRLEGGQGHEHVTLGLLARLADTLGTTPTQLLTTPQVDLDPGSPPTQDPTRTRGGPTGPAPSPRPALTIAEARALRRILDGDTRLAARGPNGTAQAHLVATGVLAVQRDTPERSATVSLSDATAEELGPDACS